MICSRSQRYSVAESESTRGLWFSPHCAICMLSSQRIKGISCFSPTLFTAIHSTIHLLKLGSPPPHKEARQRRKELRKKLLAEQEELERQMKELQAANENKQQELETVRKVGVDAELSIHCGSRSYLTYEVWFYQDQVTLL